MPKMSIPLLEKSELSDIKPFKSLILIKLIRFLLVDVRIIMSNLLENVCELDVFDFVVKLSCKI